ncbi:glycosyltransferase family 2 protein [Methanococcoides sp. FTZ1]|uniref:glycosyltransferase family 2 protein n=1 Tax=Methanococcoides sp. FTZ1 TaxID=3439061 RepID=UPI003F84A4D2
MKLTMVIPTYWGRESSIGWLEGDAIYDHATPLDHEGTLGRAIESTAILEDTDLEIVILVAPNNDEITEQVEQKVSDIIRNSATNGINIHMFGPSHLGKLHDELKAAGMGDYCNLLSLRGYSNIRNMCLFIPHLMGSDVSLLIDDDEVFEDPHFISRAKEFIGNHHNGQFIDAVAGYYLQPDGDYLVNVTDSPWTRYWDKNASMNEGFKQVIGTPPRLKETPFVFGGNMVIHRDLFMKVPFDPMVPRGEDIDYLMNARMFGHSFMLDNELAIRHLPPAKFHPTWKRMREDIYRFIYERAKLMSQKETDGMKLISAGDMGSYPGNFLRDDLEEKITNACRLLSEEYLNNNDSLGSEEAFRNIELSLDDAVPDFDPFRHLCNLQKRWSELMSYISEREEMGSVLSEMKLEDASLLLSCES